MKSITWNSPTHSHRAPSMRWQLKPHAGKHIHSVPSDYLEWALKSCKGQPQQQAMRELRRRHTEMKSKTRKKKSHQIVFNRHHNHPMSAELCESGPHKYRLRCVTCDQHIQWLSESAYHTIKSIK